MSNKNEETINDNWKQGSHDNSSSYLEKRNDSPTDERPKLEESGIQNISPVGSESAGLITQVFWFFTQLLDVNYSGRIN